MPAPGRLLLLWMLLSSCLHPLGPEICIEGRGMTIPGVLDSIHQKTGVSCDYFSGIFRDAPRLDLDLHHVDVREVLDSCLTGLRFEYLLEQHVIIIKRKPGAGVYLPLMGRIQSSSGEALPGVTIIASGVPPQLSSAAGWFEVPMKGTRTTVTVSSLGYGSATLVLSNKKISGHHLTAGSGGAGSCGRTGLWQDHAAVDDGLGHRGAGFVIRVVSG